MLSYSSGFVMQGKDVDQL